MWCLSAYCMQTDAKSAAIAKEAGFSISADDLTKAQSELSEEELEGVAGGGCNLLQTDLWGCTKNDTMAVNL